ncbi:MAG: GNAT family N-acetyltransferase, partial [Leptolyngbyaceae cyanobacterium MO_188.B28]|nr:GNAT family N-acetyltransferase [Leptolyngbyaceae cyanobacterium MO_188.B28]
VKKTTAYTIRAAGLDDLDRLADVLANSFYSRLGWRRLIHPLLKIGIYEDLKQRFRSRSVHYACLTAVKGAPSSDADNVLTQIDEAIVGTVELSTRNNYLWRIRHPRQLYLSNLAVDANCRRQGVAQQLLIACEQVAFEWGFQEVYLHVMEDNTEARRLYQKTGYRLYQSEYGLAALLWGKPKRLLMLKKIPPRV